MYLKQLKYLKLVYKAKRQEHYFYTVTACKTILKIKLLNINFCTLSINGADEHPPFDFKRLAFLTIEVDMVHTGTHLMVQVDLVRAD